MTQRKRIIWIGCFIFAATIIFLWPRTRGPILEGRSVDEWFRDYEMMRNVSYYNLARGTSASQQSTVPPEDLKRIESVFQRLGTNAVPYLAGRINQRHEYSWSEKWRSKIRQHLPPMLRRLLPMQTFRGSDSATAATLLFDHIKPPGEMLIPLIAPTLEATNSNSRTVALLALRGISSGFELARPYLERGLKSTNAVLQLIAIDVTRGHGLHQKWAVSNLVELAGSPSFDTLHAAIAALDALGTNSLPAVPRLKEMRLKEQDKKRRQVLANGIDRIVSSATLAPAQ